MRWYSWVRSMLGVICCVDESVDEKNDVKLERNAGFLRVAGDITGK